MKSQNVIHIKLDSNEARTSKRDILSTQLNLIKIEQTIGKFNVLRMQELMLKQQLHRKLKEVETLVSTIQTQLPKVQIPEILKKNHRIKMKKEEEKEEIHESHISTSTKEESPKEGSLEHQLQEIQEKLKAIQG